MRKGSEAISSPSWNKEDVGGWVGGKEMQRRDSLVC